MQAGVMSGERFCSQEALFERALRAASGLASLGVGPGDAVAIVLRNDIAFLEATLAAQAVGAYPVPVNWHFTAGEAGYVIGDSDARVVVAHADLLGVIPPRVKVLAVATPPEVADAYGIGVRDVPAGVDDWSSWLEGFEPLAERAPGAPASMIYTSGTTGKPKGVRRRPATGTPTPRSTVNVLGLGPGIRTIVPGPLYHSAPNAYALASVRLGGFVVLQPRFDARELLELIERHAITHVQLVPTMFVRMLRVTGRERFDLSSLAHVVHAAAPCPVEVKRAMIAWLGPIVNEYYGCTESGAVTSCTAADWLAHPGTVGKPVEGGIVRIFSEDGRTLPVHEVGDVYLRAPGLGDFTYQGRDADRRAIERNGLITCGDMGWLDEDGYLYLADRRKDMVISGGVNIYPAEIEAELLAMPGVHDCAVFGIPDEEYGEALCAYVQPDAGASLTSDDVRAFLRARVAGYKVPRIVEFADELPREDSGKIFKRKLREPYWAGTGRAI